MSRAINTKPIGRYSKPTTGRNQSALKTKHKIAAGMRTQRAAGDKSQRKVRASVAGNSRRMPATAASYSLQRPRGCSPV